MKRFEYRIDHEDPGTHKELDQALAWLNVQGAEGWELIELYRTPIHGGMLVFLWKRELIEVPANG